MFKIRWMPIAGCLPIIIFLAVSSSHGAATSKPSPRDLVLRLEPSKRVFVLYEPVFLTCKLMNPTTSTVIFAIVAGTTIIATVVDRRASDTFA